MVNRKILVFAGILLICLLLAACKIPFVKEEKNETAIVENETAVNETINETIAVVEEKFCVDSDNGKKYNIKGNTYDNSLNKTDECIDEKMLREYYCADNIVKLYTYECPGKCEDCKCVEVEENETNATPDWPPSEFEGIEYKVESNKKAWLKFNNSEGYEVRFDLIGKDISEKVMLGTSYDYDDELSGVIFMEDESCKPDSDDVVDCEGARFLVVNNGEAHIIEITDIDIVEQQIDFKDITYNNTEDLNNDYVNDDNNEFSLLGGAGTIKLYMQEDRIKFDDIGSHHGAIMENYAGKNNLKIINKYESSPRFEGFVIKHETADLVMNAIYDYSLEKIVFDFE